MVMDEWPEERAMPEADGTSQLPNKRSGLRTGVA